MQKVNTQGGYSTLSLIVWMAVVVSGMSALWLSSGQVNKKLILGHNLNEEHPVHLGLVAFKKKLSSLSSGKLEVLLYPNGQLGPERDVLELIQLGAVAMTKVSSMNLEAFAPEIAVLNLPYMFRSKKHYYNVLDSEIGEKMLRTPTSKLLRGLTYYDSGARSFYTRKPILHPKDLKGLKIRVMGSQTAIRMVKLLGGSPTPMPYGEIYTGLQQGVIDGAESNITALTLGRHGEVIKNFSKNEHTMLPDILIISERIWRTLTPQMKKWVKQAAAYSKKIQRRKWKEAIEKANKQARTTLKITFQHPDKAPFMKKVHVMHEELARRGPLYKSFIDDIRKAQ